MQLFQDDQSDLSSRNLSVYKKIHYILMSFTAQTIDSLVKLFRPIKVFPLACKAHNRFLLALHRLMPSSSIHVLFRQLKHPSDHIQSKIAIELLLIINHVSKPFVYPKLHVEVRKILRYRVPKTFHASVDELLRVVLTPLALCFVDRLLEVKRSFFRYLLRDRDALDHTVAALLRQTNHRL